VHFTADEIREHFLQAGFSGCELLQIHDPFVAVAATPEAAELNIGEYLVDMYGLSRVREKLGAERASRWAVERAKQIFRYPDGLETTMEQLGRGDSWRITIPRLAIVGVGRKP
jgi:hypothetical protein